MRKLIKQFLTLESGSGIFLFVMALLALLWANSPFEYLHRQFVDKFLFWINEGAMAVFFLLVGLELKRGYLEGRLSSFSQIALPGIAALGGMLVPALLYIVINTGHTEALKGWATPVATDIAFALGVLLLFGKKIPSELKLFLLALAIFDDVGAIIIITLFYSHGLDVIALLQAGIALVILYLFNYLNVRSLLPYLLIGAWLWLCFLNAGIHPTLAGFLLAMMIPGDVGSPLEIKLHPYVAYVIMPLFALANAGFSFATITGNSLLSTIVLGVALGLFVGKQVGVFIFSWLLIRLRFAKLPAHSSWFLFYGVATLCGIGFTMSLFLGTLSFQYDGLMYINQIRLGVMMGSLLSGVMGALILSIAKEKPHV